MNRLEKEWSTGKKLKAGRKRKGSSLFVLQTFMRGFFPLSFALSIKQNTQISRLVVLVLTESLCYYSFFLPFPPPVGYAVKC